MTDAVAAPRVRKQMNWRIPFNRPCLAGNELDYIAQAVASGHISGDGSFTRKCQALFERELGVHKALLTTSCTHALELAAMLLNLGPGDEVIVPSFTFVTSASAFVLRGTRPVFADIRPDTLNIDERQVERLITPATKAIVVVHYAGVGCEMDSIMEVADRHRLAVVEDNAHGLFGRVRGQLLGTIGCLATQSFHETKNVTCGEGGALLINDSRYVERAEILREKGTDRSRFFRGQVDKYTWTDLGSSYLPSDLLAAFLYAQLEAATEIQIKRRDVWRRYKDGLADWAEEQGVGLPNVPTYCEQPYHMFYLVMPSLATREALIEKLAERGIMSVFHYLPLHLSAVGRRYGGNVGDCPVTESISERLVRLPFFNDLTESEQSEVIEMVRAFPVAGNSHRTWLTSP